MSCFSSLCLNKFLFCNAERLKQHFEAYGEVVETIIMKDRATGRARGFGFVVFADPSIADQVVQEKHTIDGRQVRSESCCKLTNLCV